MNNKKIKIRRQFVLYTLVTSQILGPVFVPLAHASKETDESEFEYNTMLSDIAGSLASQSTDAGVSDALNNTLIEQVNNAAEHYITTKATDWLSQYGTASFEFNINSAMEFQSGELDLLVPFFSQQNDNAASTWFIQPGFVFNENDLYNGRRFVHFGVGYRDKSEDSFIGFNLFYDYDLDHLHHRASLGVEYTREFFKVNSNYYFPLSGWKESPTRFASIGEGVLLEERAAQGVDVSFTGYLPQVPWLSLNMKYQQYFGTHVEISNANKPIKNPFIASALLNVQPISLLSLNLGYEYEQGNEGEPQIGMNVNYKIGVPFEKQIKISEVENQNNLEFQLLDLVERDHNIRLEYREAVLPATIVFKEKDNLIQEMKATDLLSLLSITGDKSQIKNIVFEGTAKEHITNNSVFSAPFHNTGVNTYTLSAKIILNNGNEKMAPSIANIVVTEDKQLEFQINPGDVKIHAVGNQNTSTGMVGSMDKPGAGVEIKAIIRNRFGRPVSDKKVTFLTQMPSSTFKQTEAVSDKNGEVHTALFSTKTAVVPFHITVDNFVYNGIASFDATDGKPSDVLSKLSSSHATIEANGLTQSTLRLALKDENDNPLSGKSIIAKAFKNGVELPPDPKITLSEFLEEGNGIYTASIKGTSAEPIEIRATVTGFPDVLPIKTTVNLNSDHLEPSIATSVFERPNSIVADGVSSAELSLTLKDKNSNSLSGRHVVFTAFDTNAQPILEGINISSPTESSGIYKANVTGTKAGIFTIKAAVDGASSFNKSVQIDVTLPADIAPDMGKSSLSASKSTVQADGHDSSRLFLKLKDVNGNPLKGKTIEFSFLRDGQPLPAVPGVEITPVQELEDGVYTSRLSGISAGKLSIKAKVTGVASFEESMDIMFETFTLLPSMRTSTLTATPYQIPANGTAITTLELLLKDKNNNPLSNREVVFRAFEGAVDKTDNVIITEVIGTGPGTYSVNISGNQALQLKITAEVIGVSAFQESANIQLTPVR